MNGGGAEDYDDWTIERKRELVKEYLDEATNGYKGTKIADFKSKIIEDYLSQSQESRKKN